MLRYSNLVGNIICSFVDLIVFFMEAWCYLTILSVPFFSLKRTNKIHLLCQFYFKLFFSCCSGEPIAIQEAYPDVYGFPGIWR